MFAFIRSSMIVMCGLLLTVASGVLYGHFSNRWGPPRSLQEAAIKLDRFPDAFGDWQLTGSEPLTDETVVQLKCAAYVHGKYVNVRTGQEVNLALLLGPAGPIAVHTPEVCYSQSDFSIVDTRRRIEFEETNGQTAMFWALNLCSKHVDAARLRVCYGWSDGAFWTAPESSRWHFAGRPYLYKIQVAAPLGPLADTEEEDPCLGFLQEFIPRARRDLLRLPDEESQDACIGKETSVKENKRQRTETTMNTDATIDLLEEGQSSFDRDACSGLVPAAYFRTKAYWERIAAVLLLIVGAPLIGLLTVLLRATSRGPAIYRQRRVGRTGRIYVMYKIRTMVRDAERTTGPTWASMDDPRLTRLGRFMRRTHLDELPQLFNVAKGEMSLIGPRPERPEFVDILVGEIPGYRGRLVVRPGITGLAQVNLPPDREYDCVRRKLVLDREYIRQAHLFLDLRILGYTLLRFCALPSGPLARLFGIMREVSIPSEMYPAVDQDAERCSA